MQKFNHERVDRKLDAMAQVVWNNVHIDNKVCYIDWDKAQNWTFGEFKQYCLRQSKSVKKRKDLR